MHDGMALSAFKILTADQWVIFQTAGVFEGAPIDLADGYIHMSTAQQLGETLAKHFAGQSDLVIAEIDLADVGDALKWEVSRGGEMFPHLYAPLPMSALIRVAAHPLIAPIPDSLAKLRNVGKAALKDFAILDIHTVAQLSICDPDYLHTTLEKRTGVRQDPCVWDVFAATIHQARTGEAKNWWAFTAIRKARHAR